MCRRQHFFILVQMKKHILIFATLALFISTEVSAQASKLSTEDREVLAKSQLDDKQYQQSIANYDILINENANNAYYFNQRGIAYFSLKNMKKAKENFVMATLYSNQNSTYWANLSAAYNNLNDNKRSYDASLKALQYGKSELSIFNAGSAANNYNMLDKGIEILTNPGEFYHNDQEELLGRLYYKKENYDKSVEHFSTFFKNYNADDSTVLFIMEDEKRTYFFALVGKLLMDVNSQKKYDYKKELADTFIEVVNAKGYQYEGEFVASSAEWMRFVLKADPNYKTFFVGLADKITNDNKKQEYIKSLEENIN